MYRQVEKEKMVLYVVVTLEMMACDGQNQRQKVAVVGATYATKACCYC